MTKKNPLMMVLLLSGVFFLAFIALSAIVVWRISDSKPSSKKGLLSAGKSEQIGVIELKGVIADSKRFLRDLDDLVEASNVGGIIVKINSPGGVVAPSQEIFQGLREANKKKPVYASLGSLAASGGYYAAVGAKKIYSNPGTITGSIGVIMSFANLSKLYEWAKVSPYSIKTGKFKDIGSPNREMTADEKALLQEMIDNVLGQFRKAVSEGRGMPMEKVIELSDGRIFSGEQAKNLKLVDELGSFNDTVDALSKELGYKDKPRLVYPEKHKKLLERLMGDSDDDIEGESESLFSRSLNLAEAVVSLLGSGHLPEKVQSRIAGGSVLGSFAGPMYLAPLFSPLGF